MLTHLMFKSFGQATGQLSVSFRNMSLKKIKRAEKKGTESGRVQSQSQVQTNTICIEVESGKEEKTEQGTDKYNM